MGLPAQLSSSEPRPPGPLPSALCSACPVTQPLLQEVFLACPGRAHDLRCTLCTACSPWNRPGSGCFLPSLPRHRLGVLEQRQPIHLWAPRTIKVGVRQQKPGVGSCVSRWPGSLLGGGGEAARPLAYPEVRHWPCGCRRQSNGLHGAAKEGHSLPLGLRRLQLLKVLALCPEDPVLPP